MMKRLQRSTDLPLLIIEMFDEEIFGRRDEKMAAKSFGIKIGDVVVVDAGTISLRGL